MATDPMSEYRSTRKKLYEVKRSISDKTEEIEKLIAGNNKMTDGQKRRSDDLMAAINKLGKQEIDLHERMEVQYEEGMRAGLANGTITTHAGAEQPYGDGQETAYDAPLRTGRTRSFGDPWAGDQGARFNMTAGETRARALSAVERADGVEHDARERYTRELEQAKPGEHLSRLSAWTLAVSDPHYLRSFLKLAADPQNGHREFTDRELSAFQRTQTVARAMSLTSTAGGFLLPFQLDPSVILTSAGGTNPIRQIARKVVGTSDTWHGVSSAGVTASWDAEAAEVSDDAPTLAQPTIPVWKMAAFVPISVEAFEDELNVAAEVGKLLADAADVLEAQALQTGSGSGQPTGIVTALVTSSPTVIVAQAGTTLDAADLLATQQALGPRFQPNAKWIMALASMNRLRSIPLGSGLTTPMLDDSTNPPMMLGKPVYEASFMDGTVTGSANDYLAVYGDFSNMVVVDRIGTTVELIPHLFGANGRPTGQRGWWMHRRVGADSVNDAAFTLLNKSA